MRISDWSSDVCSSDLDLLVVREIGGPYGLLTVLAWLLGAIAVVTFPARRVQRWGFKIGEGQLRVARGWLFRTDTIVPFVRVQHIDVGQGPEIGRASSRERECPYV